MRSLTRLSPSSRRKEGCSILIAAIDPVLGVVGAGIISALGAYILAAKKMSGTVKSSDAETLWAESRSIREWSADRIAQLTGIIGSLETRVDAVENRNQTLLSENERLIDQVSELREELHNCRATIATLTHQLELSENAVNISRETIVAITKELQLKEEDVSVLEARIKEDAQ